MRFLILGAGAVGGYFGGRLLEAGQDVTFLVRPARARALAERGLQIVSHAGNAHLAAVPTLEKCSADAPFDVILLTCKSYDLESAMASIAPAVGPQSLIIPLLNGMGHLSVLDARFGPEHVLGGACFISARLNETGAIHHLSDAHRLVFGERAGGTTDRVQAIAHAMHDARFELGLSEHIIQEMWEKWSFLATLAGITCTTRASIGDVMACGGRDMTLALFDECLAIAGQAGYPPRPAALELARKRLTDPASRMMASMLGDLESHGRTECEQILGDLLRASDNPATPAHSLLRTSYIAIKAAEARLARERAGQTGPAPAPG